MNRTIRCRHGFATNVVGFRCPSCVPRPSDYRESEARPRGSAQMRFRIGEQVAGITILSRDIDDFVALCGCGKEFEVSRTTIANRVRAGLVVRCWECRDAARELEKTG